MHSMKTRLGSKRLNNIVTSKNITLLLCSLMYSTYTSGHCCKIKSLYSNTVLLLLKLSNCTTMNIVYSQMITVAGVVVPVLRPLHGVEPVKQLLQSQIKIKVF